MMRQARPWQANRGTNPRRLKLQGTAEARLDARVVQGVQGTLSITDAVEIHIASARESGAFKENTYPPEVEPPISKQ